CQQRISTSVTSTPKLYSASELVHLAYLANGIMGPDPKPRKLVPTGFPLIDETVGGMSPGTLTIVAGKPNVGKTTAAIHMGYCMVCAGHVPGMISLEDDPVLTGERVQAIESHINAQTLRISGYDMRHDPAFGRTINKAKDFHMKFSFPLYCSMEEVVASMDAMVSSGCDVIFIDYFTAIENASGTEARMGFNRMLINLKSQAKRLEVPLVLMAQVGRMKDRMWEEPYLEDLQETSSLEQKAELVILFWKNEAGDTFGKLAKAKYGRKYLPKFACYQNANTGLLETKDLKEIEAEAARERAAEALNNLKEMLDASKSS
ncbi:MAG: DnaB helicase C-terminal domain-containing protein, partial [Nitrososphaera sp.]|nr:DnaB helicase C-terminal domain-containing protein [Nitrososphaera sp.]